jgi:hypothetical protein
MEHESLSHESFGQIQFNRSNANGTHFYGSELPQDHYISMEVHHSEIHRELTQDRYYNRGQVLRIRLSSGQFAEMLTSMNCGSGVPCTIERIEGRKIGELPMQESRKEFVHRKFEDRMKMFGDTIRERQNKAKELVKKKTLSKDDMHQLQMHLEWLTGEVERNIPFFAKCFQSVVLPVTFSGLAKWLNPNLNRVTKL